MSTQREPSLTPFRTALGFPSAKKEPVRSLVVVIPTDHVFSPERVAARPEIAGKPDADVIVACAGQPADLATIHAHLPSAQFLLAPAGANDEELRVLALAQAVGDIVTLVSGVKLADRDAVARRARSGQAAPKISVIVPVHNGGPLLDATLAAILASSIARDSYELVVVDDASTDDSAMVAARHADTVIRLAGRRRGPAYARNRGADEARGDVIVFVDADTRIHRDTIPRLLASLAEDSGLAAVGASNDGATADGGLSTQYWNALLQYGAQRQGGLGSLFTAACGAVRKSALVAVGMYNEWIFRRSSLEDLELGQRLHKVGQRVLLSTDVAISQLRGRRMRGILVSAWSLSSLLMRSVGYRTTRMRARGHVVHTLCSVRAMWAFAAGVAVILGAQLTGAGWVTPLAIAAALLIFANLEIFRFFSQRRGVAFSIAIAPLHFVTQLTAITGLCIGWLLRTSVGDPAPDATTQAFAEMGVQMWPPVPRKP